MVQDLKEDEIVHVSLDVVWNDTNKKVDARLSELSLIGGHIDCLAQASAGEMFDFKLRLPSGHWIALKGEITYSDYPMGFGFRFTNLPPEGKRLIAQVVAASGGKYAENFLSGASSAIGQPTEQPNRILIADDDAMTLRLLTAIIESENYSVVTAEDGREAFRILSKDNNFSAAIFDMTMPHFDGLDLIQYMKADQRLKNIPIGMITAEQDPKIWNDSVAAGANVFLPKPFSPPQVKMMVGMLTSRKNS